MRKSISVTAGGTPLGIENPAPRRTPKASETISGDHRIIEFRPRKVATLPEGPKPTPLSGCSPVRYRIEDFRMNIIAAARGGRHYRSIAAQYGLNALEVWHIVTDALAAETRRDRRAA